MYDFLLEHSACILSMYKTWNTKKEKLVLSLHIHVHVHVCVCLCMFMLSVDIYLEEEGVRG